MTSVAEPAGATWARVGAGHPLARPMLAELEDEYLRRYGASARREMTRYPAGDFAPPDGVLLLLLEDGDPVAGGAFRRYDATGAELKRIWTHSAHRRRGLARRVVTELERIARARGYRRVFLTTGSRQPEAKALYLSAGYTPLFDTAADPESLDSLPFEKHLVDGAGAG
ncbi:GNAT family N-acetyltransferase [Streptomyces sp. NPDC003077]|uniref:GNAT family N-acetyltransferase n=1 Tax=Streptomyces sp. NPDC003077 TaxID=3154443 RepID=UPI0033AF9016